jgi:hypothetical protein
MFRGWRFRATLNFLLYPFLQKFAQFLTIIGTLQRAGSLRLFGTLATCGSLIPSRCYFAFIG